MQFNQLSTFLVFVFNSFLYTRLALCKFHFIDIDKENAKLFACCFLSELFDNQLLQTKETTTDISALIINIISQNASSINSRFLRAARVQSKIVIVDTLREGKKEKEKGQETLFENLTRPMRWPFRLSGSAHVCSRELPCLSMLS